MEPRGRDVGMTVANKAFQKVERDRGRARPTCVLFSCSFVCMYDCAQNNSTGRNEKKEIDKMKTNELELDSVRKSVREHYGNVASRGSGCGSAPASGSAARLTQPGNAATISRAVGY